MAISPKVGQGKGRKEAGCLQMPHYIPPFAEGSPLNHRPLSSPLTPSSSSSQFCPSIRKPQPLVSVHGLGGCLHGYNLGSHGDLPSRGQGLSCSGPWPSFAKNAGVGDSSQRQSMRQVKPELGDTPFPRKSTLNSVSRPPARKRRVMRAQRADFVMS